MRTGAQRRPLFRTVPGGHPGRGNSGRLRRWVLEPLLVRDHGPQSAGPDRGNVQRVRLRRTHQGVHGGQPERQVEHKPQRPTGPRQPQHPARRRIWPQRHRGRRGGLARRAQAVPRPVRRPQLGLRQGPLGRVEDRSGHGLQALRLLLPATSVRWAICYRADLFKAAGLPSGSGHTEVAKALGTSWDDYFALGEQFKAKSKVPWMESAGAVYNAMVNQASRVRTARSTPARTPR